MNAGERDLAEAHARWGTSIARPVFRAADVPALIRRLPLAMALAAEGARDPWACWIAITAIRRHGALQKPVELSRYIHFLKRRRIVRAMEIGTLWGGTFYAHCAVAGANGRLIAVDSFPGANKELITRRFESFARPGQQVTCIWNDSHAEATRDAVEEALAGDRLDLLFIDGDHSDEGVRQDYACYAPFVRSGGLIVLHDVASARSDGVPALWRTLKARHTYKEFVDRLSPPHGLGIGAIVKP